MIKMFSNTSVQSLPPTDLNDYLKARDEVAQIESTMRMLTSIDYSHKDSTTFFHGKAISEKFATDIEYAEMCVPGIKEMARKFVVEKLTEQLKTKRTELLGVLDRGLNLEDEIRRVRDLLKSQTAS